MLFYLFEFHHSIHRTKEQRHIQSPLNGIFIDVQPEARERETWNRDTDKSEGNGHFPIGFDLIEIQFQSEKEHEEDQTKIGNQGEYRKTGWRPNGCRPAFGEACNTQVRIRDRKSETTDREWKDQR